MNSVQDMLEDSKIIEQYLDQRGDSRDDDVRKMNL